MKWFALVFQATRLGFKTTWIYAPEILLLSPIQTCHAKRPNVRGLEPRVVDLKRGCSDDTKKLPYGSVDNFLNISFFSDQNPDYIFIETLALYDSPKNSCIIVLSSTAFNIF